MAASASGAPRNDDRAWVHVDIPGDFDPYCDRLLAPRSPAEGKLRCVVRLSADRRRDVCLHIEEGNVRWHCRAAWAPGLPQRSWPPVGGRDGRALARPNAPEQTYFPCPPRLTDRAVRCSPAAP
eukprot:scaffold3726_cov107-Isochrysis_galbana.AAC.2